MASNALWMGTAAKAQNTTNRGRAKIKMPYQSKMRRVRQSEPTGPVVLMAAAEQNADTAQSKAELARKDLLKQINDFVMKHAIAVNGWNLAIICNALSG